MNQAFPSIKFDFLTIPIWMNLNCERHKHFLHQVFLDDFFFYHRDQKGTFFFLIRNKAVFDIKESRENVLNIQVP